MAVFRGFGPDDVGHRVVVRHHTPAGATDVLGELVTVDNQSLVVRTESGQLHQIARADVVAGKPVGPRPPRYSEMIALERVADRAWPAPEVQELGQWRLRFADGFTNRANSALPLGEADRPLPEAVAACVRFYEERGVRPRITVPLPVRRDVARHLDAAEWVAQPEVLVQTAALSMPPASAEAVILADRPTPDLLALVAARKEGLPTAAQHVLWSVPAVRFAHARREDGTLVGGARGALVDGWLHLGLVEVVPSARRQGVARAVTAALVGWAVAAGAARAVLQVERRNEPARQLYSGLGFATHHTYVTYHRPAD